MNHENQNLTRRSFFGTVAGTAALGQIGSMNIGAAELQTTFARLQTVYLGLDELDLAEEQLGAIHALDEFDVVLLQTHTHRTVQIDH